MSDALKNITFDQIRAPLERVVYILLAWLAGKGYLGPQDVAGIGTLIVAIAAAFWGYWINRPHGILASAQALPEVTKITTTSDTLNNDPSLPKVTS